MTTRARAPHKNMATFGMLMLIQLLFFMAIVIVKAQICSDLRECVECAAQGCAWAVGTCTDTCPQDVACVANTTTTDPSEFCDRVETDRLDNLACGATNNCAICTTTPLPSNITQKCKWFGGRCSATCNSFTNGCQETPCPVCENVNVCTVCADAGCAWANGTCAETCPQNVVCIFDTDTPEQLCAVVEKERLDNEACRAITDDGCEACTTTLLPLDDSRTCKWFDDSYCGATCTNFDGCEETGCISTSTCGSIGSCVDCATAGCAWALGSCSEQCPQDTACVFDNDAPMELCTTVEANRMDNEECRTKQGCDECTSTTLPSNGTKTCKWFDDSYCGATCENFDGCEETECSACSGIDTCQACATAGCAWFGSGSCLDECPQNILCIFESSNPEQDCAAFEEQLLDNEECSFEVNCGECITTILPSDGNKTCKWFDDSYCGATCDVDSGCQETECPSCNDLSSCVDCASQGCAWGADACSDECPQNIACVVDTASPEPECLVLEEEKADNEACELMTSCDECIMKELPSDADKKCRWFEGCNGTCNYCAATCTNSDGCDDVPCSSCSVGDSCLNCTSQGCAWHGTGSCSDECPKNVLCIFESSNPQQDCAAFEEQRLDNEACSLEDNCGECITTILLSNGNKTCKWFDDSYCGATCDVESGCQETECPSCNDLSSCVDCASQGCAWSGDTCSDECPQDMSCISDTASPESECLVLEEEKADNEACKLMTSCDECIMKELPSDADKKCRWFEGNYCAATCNNFDGCDQVDCATTSTMATSAATSFQLVLVLVALITSLSLL